MESQEVSESARFSNDSSLTSCSDGSERLGSGVKGSEDLGFDIVEDFDSYCEDINDRLMVSRMVSDSVIKGMVNAVEQYAADKLYAKDLELAKLKESLWSFAGSADKNELPGSSVLHPVPESKKSGQVLSCMDACVEHDKMRESLHGLRNDATEQFKRLKKEIDGVKGFSHIRRNGSGSELVGLGGILRESGTESWNGVDRTVDSLKTAVDVICERIDDVLCLSKGSLCEWWQEQEFQGEIEDMVMQSSIRSLREEFEEKFWDQNVCRSQTVNWLDKFNEISSMRKELETIIKLLPHPENGHLNSHGSSDMDPSHRKTLSSHTSISSAFSEANGKVDESKTTFDADKFKHLEPVELFSFFNTTISNMKRDHESTVAKMTEEYFTLKREYLNEKGSSMLLRKDKELDTMRKKIPEVISKLDDILVKNEKLPVFSDNAESLGGLKRRLDVLLLENRQLRDLLADKKNEVKCLSSQVSDEMFQHSSAETKLLKSISDLNSVVTDARIEASVSEEVYKCMLRELSGQIKNDSEDSEMEFLMMQEVYGVIYGEALRISSNFEIDDSGIGSLLIHDLCGILFRESIRDTEEEFRQLYEEKESLKQEVRLLVMSVEEKEKLGMQVSHALEKEKEQCKLAFLELTKLRDHAIQQETLITESHKELDQVKHELAEALGEIELEKMEISKLDKQVELVMKELKDVDEKKKILTQQRQHDLSLVDAKEKEHMKQMEAVIVFADGLSKMLANFEDRVAEDIKTSNMRLERSSSHLGSLIKKASVLRKTGFLYKQGLEKRCSDLQMAESEVDLLGDEVDTLLSLLEKIYIALDHYSPVLQHYPGIIEILKLVRRELSGESTRPV